MSNPSSEQFGSLFTDAEILCAVSYNEFQNRDFEKPVDKACMTCGVFTPRRVAVGGEELILCISHGNREILRGLRKT